MDGSIDDILNSGYSTWRKNLLIGVPYILDLIMTSALLILALVAGVIVAVVFFAFALSDLPKIYSLLLSAVPVVVASATLLILLLTFTSAFFESGAIGMAATASRVGRTRLEDMLIYGKKNTIRVFFASLAVASIMLLAFAAGAVIIFGIWSSILPLSQLFAWVIAIVLGLVLALSLLLLAIILSPTKYLIVTEDIGVFLGLMRAYRFSLDNRLPLFTIWLITALIGILFSAFDFVAGMALGMVPVVGPLMKFVFSMVFAFLQAAVIYPLLTCWWTRLCMSAPGKRQEPVAPNLEAARPSSGTQTPGQFYV